VNFEVEPSGTCIASRRDVCARYVIFLEFADVTDLLDMSGWRQTARRVSRLLEIG